SVQTTSSNDLSGNASAATSPTRNDGPRSSPFPRPAPRGALPQRVLAGGGLGVGEDPLEGGLADIPIGVRAGSAETVGGRGVGAGAARRRGVGGGGPVAAKRAGRPPRGGTGR